MEKLIYDRAFSVYKEVRKEAIPIFKRLREPQWSCRNNKLHFDRDEKGIKAHCESQISVPAGRLAVKCCSTIAGKMGAPFAILRRFGR